MTEMRSNVSTEDKGDDKVIMRVYLAYEPDAVIVLGAPLGTAGIGCIHRLPDGSFELVFSLDRGPSTAPKSYDSSSLRQTHHLVGSCS
jgi:hypothetical protein